MHKRGMNKRGLSDIVVSVLLILLVLSAIVIIWTFVRPVVLGASKDVRTDDFTTKLDVYPKSNLNGDIQFSVKRGAGKGNLAGFYVSYQDSTGKAVTDNVNYSKVALGELESKSIGFNYTVAGLTDVVKISIVPLFNLPDNTIATGKNVIVKQIGSYTPDNTSPNIPPNTPPNTVTCTSFQYSAWSPSSCSSGQQQARTITSSSPSGCTGGNPEPLTQPCPQNSLSGLINYWRFDNNLNDEAGHNVTSWAGNVVFGTGRMGQAVSFEGMGSVFVQGYKMPGEVTIAAWVKSDVVDGNIRSILRSEAGSTYSIYKWSDNKFSYYGNPTVVSNTVMQQNRWYFVTVVCNDSDRIIYVDGVYQNKIDVGTNGCTAGVADLYIGSDLYSQRWIGEIDELKIWNKALTNSEILSLNNSAPAQSPQTQPCEIASNLPSEFIGFIPGFNTERNPEVSVYYWEDTYLNEDNRFTALSSSQYQSWHQGYLYYDYEDPDYPNTPGWVSNPIITTLEFNSQDCSWSISSTGSDEVGYKSGSSPVGVYSNGVQVFVETL